MPSAQPAKNQWQYHWTGSVEGATLPPGAPSEGGQFVDMTRGDPIYCEVDVPYPVPCAGAHTLLCRVCERTVLVVAHGTPLDAKRVRVDCHIRPQP